MYDVLTFDIKSLYDHAGFTTFVKTNISEFTYMKIINLRFTMFLKSQPNLNTSLHLNKHTPLLLTMYKRNECNGKWNVKNAFFVLLRSYAYI